MKTASGILLGLVMGLLLSCGTGKQDNGRESEGSSPTKQERIAEELWAKEFLSEIKLKQETSFAHYSSYIDTGGEAVSFGEKDLYPRMAGDDVGAWALDCSSGTDSKSGWCKLGTHAPNTTSFQYVSMGWNKGDPQPPADYISDPSRRWFYAVAHRAAGPDGPAMTFLISSETMGVMALQKPLSFDN